MDTPAGRMPRSSASLPQGVLKAEFLFESMPVPSVHASTLLETGDGLIAAWFGGRHEGADDVGIWISRHVGGAWSRPSEVADGVQPDGTRYPCWNPVLFRMPDGTVTLFYKVGPGPQTWWGMTRTSRDDGRTWGDAERLPEGILGPIKNKPVQLADGLTICPSSTESSDRPSRWRVHFELTGDAGRTWITVYPQTSPGEGEINAIQPSILVHSGNRLQAVGRTRSSRIFVYNHTTRDRSPLNLAISRDGILWEAALVLEREAGEYSYPAVIQTADGLVHITYTWRRERIKHVVIDPKDIVSVPMPTGEWPSEVHLHRARPRSDLIVAAPPRAPG